jgi:hypothetical protein
LKASGKQDMPFIYCGAIFFTIKVKVYLLFVEREERDWALEYLETQHKWFGTHHKCRGKR